MLVWLPDPAVSVRVDAGCWSPEIWTHSLSGIILFFLSAALVRLFIACSVYLFILFALGRAFVYPRPVHARGSVC